MSSPFAIQIFGVDELIYSFNLLTAGIQQRVLKQVVAKGARVMVSPLKAATPRSRSKGRGAKNPSGTMRKSVGIVTRKYKGGGLWMAFAGHRWPKGAAAHLVEFGSKQRFTKSGAARGAAMPFPFFRPVYAANKSRMMDAMREAMKVGIETEGARAAIKKFARATGTR